MLTILHSESSEGWGGQENRTLHECLGLKALGVRVIVLCRPGSRLRTRAEEAGMEVRTHAMRSSRDISAVFYSAGLIKTEAVDVVSTHSGHDSFLLALAGRLSSRRPAIVRTRHLALPITSKATYSLFPHKVVTVSEYVRRYLVDEKGLPPEKVVAIPTGVDLKRFDPAAASGGLRASLGIADHRPVVGMVAILRRKKGHHVLLDAIPGILEAVPDALFLLAGDGPQRENIEGRIAGLGIGGSVRLLGLVSDVPAFLKGIDLFVLPTLQEALGTSILEASAMGRAVVASRVGGTPEVVEEGRTGVLVEPEDPDALAGAVVRLLKDRRLMDEMGLAGRALVEAEFSTGRMVEKLYALYTGLAAGEGRRG